MFIWGVQEGYAVSDAEISMSDLFFDFKSRCFAAALLFYGILHPDNVLCGMVFVW